MDNNTMVVSTDKGIYISSDGWVSFRFTGGWEPGVSTPAKRGIGYAKGHIVAYDGQFKFYQFEGSNWSAPLENWIGRDFIYVGVPVLPK